MSLPSNQVGFIEQNFKDRPKKDVKDMVGFFYKQKVRWYIKNKKSPQVIGNILKNMTNPGGPQ